MVTFQASVFYAILQSNDVRLSGSKIGLEKGQGLGALSSLRMGPQQSLPSIECHRAKTKCHEHYDGQTSELLAWTSLTQPAMHLRAA